MGKKIKVKLNKLFGESNGCRQVSLRLPGAQMAFLNTSFFMFKEERNCPKLMTPCSVQRMLNT